MTQFIVLEGGDGAGKSTQVKLLKEHFGDRLVTTREPGGCPRAEKIREELFAHPEWPAKKQFDELWKARAHNFEEIIRPALADGKIVISDRLDSTTWAYQIVEQDHPQLIELFWEKRREVMANAEPDSYIYLDIPVEVGIARKSKHTEDQLNHLDKASIEAQKRRKEGYLEFLSHVPHVVIDAELPKGEIFKEILRIINNSK